MMKIYHLIILLPLINYIFGSLFGSFLGYYSVYISVILMTVVFFISLFLLFNIIQNSIVYKLQIKTWFFVGTYNVDWTFLFDSLTVLLLVIVTFISLLVHFYSTNYMGEDPHLIRFISYLSLFTFFMIILVTGNNFLQLFLGWEGVGLSSFLLINFWFTRIQANKAAIKAMLINKIGDLFIMLALILIFLSTYSLDYDVLVSVVPELKKYEFITFSNFSLNIIDIISLLLFLGAMGKSAQLMLHTWLPDAMEGPTPVSALIHAATMVTAGVFLLARCSFIVEYSLNTLKFISIIGALTAFFAATTGLFQNDIKKIIAYSTCSQLGYMVFACGHSHYDVGVFHLSNHAFFKALLFLGAGSIIHSMGDEQDLRKYGGLKNLLPYSYATMLIGSLALIGFPFLAGFYSKDVILEIAYAKNTSISFFCYLLGTFSAFCTAFYSTRILYLTFLGKPNSNRINYINVHENGMAIFLPLFLLSIASIFVGYISKDLLIGFGSSFWNNSLLILYNQYCLYDIEFIKYIYKTLPLIFTFLGCILCYNIYNQNLFKYFLIKQTYLFTYIYSFFSKKWYFDRINNWLFSQYFLIIFEFLSYYIIDRGNLELIGPTGVQRVIFINDYYKKYESGKIIGYIYLIFFFILFIFFVYIIFNFEIL
jgi:proton-translocating NADH-quinone oxidoreductase chain L